MTYLHIAVYIGWYRQTENIFLKIYSCTWQSDVCEQKNIFLMGGAGQWGTVWAYVWIKVAQYFSETVPKVAKEVFYLKVMFFKIAKKPLNIWVTFSWNFTRRTFKNRPIRLHCLWRLAICGHRYMSKRKCDI